MAYTPLKIAIPKPCSEDWQQMSPVPGTTARHCASCVKNVVDFTGFTDAQVHAYVREKGGNLCGRFRPDQLERPLRAVSTPTRSPLKVAAAAAGVLLATTGCSSPEVLTHSPPEVIPPLLTERPAFASPATGEVVAVTQPAPMVPGGRADETTPADSPDATEEIRLTVVGAMLIPPPPPPPPPGAKVGELELVANDNATGELADTSHLSCTVTEPTLFEDPDDYLVGDISFEEEVELPLPEQDIVPPPPPPPPPLPPPPPSYEPSLVMGIVIADLPRPTGMDRVKDTLQRILPGLPAPLPSGHLRPRPLDQATTPQDPIIYPNPFVDRFNVTLELAVPATLTVALLDPAGRLIHTQVWQATAGKNTLEVTPRPRKLQQALYYLRITDGKAFTVTKPLVR